MRLCIEGKNWIIVPHLLGRIAARLEQLNAPHADIREARVTMLSQSGRHEARVRLLLDDKTLYAMQYGDSADAALGAALRCVEGALHERRALQQGAHTPERPRLQGTPLPPGQYGGALSCQKHAVVDQ
jgi:hypothetical protein